MAIGEDRLPCDYIWFVQHSSLQYDTRPAFDRITLFNEDSLSGRPELALKATVDNNTYGHRTSDFLTYRGFPSVKNNGIGIYLDLNDNYHNGQSKAEIIARRNVGMVGHVAALTVEQQEYICVQYWQFFAYSDLEILFGVYNHEGDWNMYEQFIRVTDGIVVMAVWYHHGDKTIEYIPGIDPEQFRPKKDGDDTHRVSFIPSQDSVYIGVNGHEFFRDPGALGGAKFLDPELHYQTALLHESEKRELKTYRS